MAINWEESFKKYVAKKFEEVMGMPLPTDAVDEIAMDFDMDLEELDIRDIGMLYCLSLMSERYEDTQRFLTELGVRNYTTKLNLNEKEGVGVVNIYSPFEPLESIEINLIVTKEGMMIDWEKEEF